MSPENRTQEQQERLNARMRRRDIREHVFFRALHAEPATTRQVKDFLASAPPEVFVLLDGILPPPSPLGIRDKSLHESRIVQGFVGLVIASREKSRR